jgi:GDP-L-fucose synthase
VKKIYVAGHNGMVGRAILRRLQSRQAEGEPLQLITRSHAELDLTDQAAVRTFMEAERPDVVILAAAKVGGIHANDTFPADFIYENLMIECNVIHEGFFAGVKKLLLLGSSCIYPKAAPQPMAEDALLTGPLEPTNEPYAVAKIAGIKLCESYNRQHGVDYRSVMPTNLYGPGDNFDLNSSHVLPALIRKAHEAKLAGAPSMEIWGTGSPRREFLHVDDLADACVMLLKTYSEDQHINVGSGEDLTILEIVDRVKQAVGFAGETVCDTSKPDGTPRKLMSAAKLRAMGWTPAIPLDEGLKSTYRWFLEHRAGG